MEEEERHEEGAEGENRMNGEQYVESIRRLRENTVSREEYDRMVEDNRRLVEALTNGTGYGNEDEEEEPADINELRRSLFSPDTQRKTNLQYFTEVLELRQAILDEEGKDVFLPHNPEYRPTEQDEADAERIAKQIQECIEYANGDPHVFNVELERRCGGRKNNKR